MAKILILDDQQYVQELLCEELADDGYSVASVYDADSIMGQIDESKPDLVLLDLYLRGFEGMNVLHDIKTNHPHLPVLILSAYDSYRDDLGLSIADGYIVKSFSALNILKEKISMLLASKTESDCEVI